MKSRTINLPPEVADESVEAYGRCCQIETWFREMVYLELKAHYGEQWWEKAEHALKRSRRRGIPPSRSASRDKRDLHMSTRESDPLWFLSFDSLLEVVLDPTLWRLFEPYLMRKTLLRSKLQEIAPVRNRVAHFRNLHPGDTHRLDSLLADLDKNFWTFCTSYQSNYGFRTDWKNDPVFAELKPMAALYDGHVEVNFRVTVRPTAARRYQKSKVSGWKGALYDFLLYSRRRPMDYSQILRETEPIHSAIAHIVLDSGQDWLRITFPAVYEPPQIISCTERFLEACSHSFTLRYLDEIKEGVSSKKWHEEYQKAIRPLEHLARQWPHYVVSPTHPYNYLDPSCEPCNFFGVNPYRQLI